MDFLGRTGLQPKEASIRLTLSSSGQDRSSLFQQPSVLLFSIVSIHLLAKAAELQLGEPKENTMSFCRLAVRISKIALALACFMLLAAPMSFADIITINTTTPAPNFGFIGNSVSFTVDGLTMTATAWGNTYTVPAGSDQRLAAGRVIQGGAGLGVCDASESFNCDLSVDNIGPNNFILLTFSQQVDPLTVRITIVNHSDWDAAYRVGNIGSSDLTGLSYFSPDQLGGFAPWQYAPSGANTFPITIPIGSLMSVNALLIGANPNEIFTGGTENDGFKISQVVVNTVPEPTSLLLLGSCLSAISVGSFYRRRKGQ